MGFDQLLTKVFGSSNQRFLKSVEPLVEKINELEPATKKLTDGQLRARTAEFKEQLQRAVADASDPEDRKRREREALEKSCPRPLPCKGGQRPHHRDAAFRRAVDGGTFSSSRMLRCERARAKRLLLPSGISMLNGRGGVHGLTVMIPRVSRRRGGWARSTAFWASKSDFQNDMDDFDRQAAYAATNVRHEQRMGLISSRQHEVDGYGVQRGHYFATS